MKRVRLAYGTDGLTVDVPDDATVISPTEPPALADEDGAVRHALRTPVAGPPLAEVVEQARRRARGGGTGDMGVVVVFPDITRPMPNRTVLPPVLAELERAGAGPETVTLLCATGTHRLATPGELVELLGPEIVARYRVAQHEAADAAAHVEVGRVDGTPVLLDRRYVDADVRVLTGFVEPHFFAGFSGGPKGACPGLAALDTVLEAHSPARIADARATWLVTTGNPVHDFVRAAVALVPPDLSLDVAIDGARRLTAVFAGALPDGHEAACRYVGRTAVQQVDRPFDVVLSTNGGYPLDRNLYQAVKGMAAADRVVRDGGTIVMAAQCRDGTPGDGAFARLLAAAAGPAELAATDGPSATDRWQVQVLGRVLRRAEVWMHAEGLSDDDVRAAHMRPVADVAGAVTEALHRVGDGARLGVLPFGPFTVATATGAGPDATSRHRPL